MGSTTAPFPLAEPRDVLARWVASTPPPDDGVVTQYLADAEELLAVEFPLLQSRAREDPVFARRAKLAICRMVLRTLSNPDNVRSIQDTTGPFSGSVTYGSETLGGLEVTDAERAILDPARTRRKRRQHVFSIGPALADPNVHTYAVNGPGE